MRNLNGISGGPLPTMLPGPTCFATCAIPILTAIFSNSCMRFPADNWFVQPWAAP
jgi:hypothetical protein